MQFSAAAVLALAATASATYTNGTVAYVTSVYTAYTTVCPASTEISFNGITYTATASTTLTITNCPCTVVKPVTTSAVVAPSSAPVYTNGTVATTSAAVVVPTTAVGTTSVKVSATATPSPTAPISASSGNKAFAMSGAGLAGVLAFAAYVL